MAYEGSVACTVVRRAVTNWISLHRFDAGCFCSGGDLIVAQYIKGDGPSVHRTPSATSSFHHTHTHTHTHIYTCVHTHTHARRGKVRSVPQRDSRQWLENKSYWWESSSVRSHMSLWMRCDWRVRFFALFRILSPGSTPLQPQPHPHNNPTPQSNTLAYIWGIHRTH